MFSHCLGTKRVLSCSTAASAGPASGFMLTNHCVESIGSTTAPERWLAWAVHRLLLVALVAQVITGPLYLFTEGEGVDVFGWFTVYLPLESLAVIHEPAELVHVVSGLYVIPALIALHWVIR